MANDHNMKYFKTSAFSGENVKELIESTIEQVYKQKIIPKIEEELRTGIKEAENIKLGETKAKQD